MKKLLHDRLREWAEKSKEEDRFPATIALNETYEYDFDDAKVQERKLFFELADEIERYYIPRSQFEDGECKESEYNRGFDDAAKNPKAWWVPGKNGDQVHIGDKFRYSESGLIHECQGFEFDDDAVFIIDDGCYLADDCKKVIPDTREKIKEELTAALYESTSPDIDIDAAIDQAEQFIARIEALEYGGKYDL